MLIVCVYSRIYFYIKYPLGSIKITFLNLNLRIKRLKKHNNFLKNTINYKITLWVRCRYSFKKPQ